MSILNIFQIIVSLLLIASILLQQRGGGLSPVFGGEGGVYRTRRGIERTVFISSIVLGVIFLALAVVNFLY